MQLARRKPALALTALEPAQPYELGNVAQLAPAFLRGRARLEQGDADGAIQEFELVLEHRGVDPFSGLHALARLELARARARAGDKAGALADYDRFLELWADADRELPVLVAAQRDAPRCSDALLPRGSRGRARRSNGSSTRTEKRRRVARPCTSSTSTS